MVLLVHASQVTFACPRPPTPVVRHAKMNEPALTVIIPTYNRVEFLRACLESLRLQTQPPSDFEVVVVVDGSTDGTRELLGSLATPYRLRAIYQQNCGQHIARNSGAAVATTP